MLSPRYPCSWSSRAITLTSNCQFLKILTECFPWLPGPAVHTGHLPCSRTDVLPRSPVQCSSSPSTLMQGPPHPTLFRLQAGEQGCRRIQRATSPRYMPGPARSTSPASSCHSHTALEGGSLPLPVLHRRKLRCWKHKCLL